MIFELYRRSTGITVVIANTLEEAIIMIRKSEFGYLWDNFDDKELVSHITISNFVGSGMVFGENTSDRD